MEISNSISVQTYLNEIKKHDVLTYQHSCRVAKISDVIGNLIELSPKELNNLYDAAILHDLGKIMINDDILNKPGELTAQEWRCIKKHPIMGIVKIQDDTKITHAIPGILFHHERFDGSGYPCGLKGNEIPLNARIIAIADSLDAMTSYRPYAKFRGIKFALHEIISHAGDLYDPHISKRAMQILS